MKKLTQHGWLLALMIGFAFGKMTWERPVSDGLPPMCGPDEIGATYICSMHPEYRSEAIGKCPVCGMELVRNERVEAVDPTLIRMTEEALELSNIQTFIVRNSFGDVSRKLALKGEITADESRVYTQVANLPGRIERLYVRKTGEFVRKGQPIASIYSRDLIAALENFIYNSKSEPIIRSTYNNLRNWGITEDQLKQFDLKGDYRKPIDIYAEAEGFVLEKKVTEGEQASNTYMGHPTPLFTIADLGVVWAVFEVLETDLKFIQTGQGIEFSVIAFPEKRFKGDVDFIGRVVRPDRKTLEIRVVVQNPGFHLKPGMSAYGEVSLPGLPTDLWIPKTALLRTGERSVVYIRDRSFNMPVFQLREVVVEAGGSDYFKVLKGLQKGDEIVTHGAFTIDAAAQLAGAPSMMNFLGSEVPAQVLTKAKER